MFTLPQLLEATAGRLIQGKEDIVVKGISIDSRTIKDAEAFVCIKGEHFDGHDFARLAIDKGARCIIYEREDMVARAKDVGYIKVADTKKALADIASYHRSRFSFPFIAITGSAGKTTTKEMAAHLLGSRFNLLKNEGTKNNLIGVALTLLNLRPEHEMAVLELGTNHFGEIRYLARIVRPSVGIITNIGPSHLEFLKSPEGVFREKSTLLTELLPPAIAILNADDQFLRSLLKKRLKPWTIGFGISQQADFRANKIRRTKQGISFCAGKERMHMATLGRDNVYNALAAIALARIFGLDYGSIKTRLASFSFPSGRLNLIKKEEINFIDDTYNANPLSLQQALEAFFALKTRGRRILILGDMLELGKDAERFHRQVIQRIKGNFDVFVAVGDLITKAARMLPKNLVKKQMLFCCADSQQARALLWEKIRPAAEDVVLVKGSRRMKMEEVFR